MRNLVIALSCGFAMQAHAAPTDQIRELGLSATIETLKAQETLSADDQLALSGVTFLRAIEKAYQERWRVGFTGGDVPLPLLAGELPANPAPEPLSADIISDLFGTFLADMAETDARLATIPDDAGAAFELSLPDVWFDINKNGTRDGEESFTNLALHTMFSPWQVQRMQQELENNPDAENPLNATIRFDQADIHWLRAYTQAVSGVSELVLAFDPTPEIQKALDLREALAEQVLPALAAYPQLQELLDQSRRMHELSDEEREALEEKFAALTPEEMEILTNTAGGAPGGAREFAHFADIAAIVIETLRHSPDAVRVQKAQAHFLDMVAHNRTFWALLNQETDNDREWIPNSSQTAAMGIEMPGGIDEAWLAVLGDAEKMLKGELLVPFWRYAPGYGVDIQAWVDDPGPLNLIGWIQGTATLPYTRQGEVMTTENWNRFRQLVRRQSGLFVIWLN